MKIQGATAPLPPTTDVHGCGRSSVSRLAYQVEAIHNNLASNAGTPS